MRVGIYIDAPNFLGMIRSIDKRIDIKKFLDHLDTKKRNIALKKVFFDRNPDEPNENFERFIGFLHHAGFETFPVNLKRLGQNGSNGYKSRTDWELAFAILDDVIEDRVDVIVLVSGDSDFKKVLEECKKIKKRLIIEIYATRPTMSYDSKQIATDFFFFEDFPDLLLSEKEQKLAS